MRNADSCPRTAIKIEELFRKSGFGDVMQNLFSRYDQLDLILSNNKVRGVNFTGSGQSGSIIGSTAGKYLKKSVLELGGSDPFIIMEDANIDYAIELLISSRLTNCGQICFSAKRIIVHENVYEEIKSKLLNRLKNINIGDPFDEKVELGPIAREDLLLNLLNQIERSKKHGNLNIVYGGERLNREGNFITPLLVECNDPTNPLLKEELFGPVFTLIK